MNAKSYNQTIDSIADRLFRFVVKNLNKDVETARDIVQNSLEVLWKNKAAVPFEKAKAYLFQVAYHQIIDVYRKQGRLLYVDNHHENDLSISPDLNDQREIMHRVLQTLPSMQRSMIMLKDYEGYSYAEIANILEVNEGQVKINIFRARKKLKALILSPQQNAAK